MAMIAYALNETRSNQTVAGLKSVTRTCGTLVDEWFKSDRGGIEIRLWRYEQRWIAMFKSDRGGIEISKAVHVWLYTERFKSDRGGIEISSSQVRR